MNNALGFQTLKKVVLISLIVCGQNLSSVYAEVSAGNIPDDTRPRVILLSDFPPLDVIPGGAGNGPAEKRSDPDDIQSMVRMLLYSNDLDIEALVASAGTFANIANKQNIFDVIEIYDQVDDYLRQRDVQYPTPGELRKVTWQGRSGTWGKPVEQIVGEDKDTEASEEIIRLVDLDDPRPVWVGVWGGPADLSQAIWKVQQTRNEEELQRFLSKIRVFMIGLGNKTGQDGSGQWLLDTFPELFVIVSQKTYAGMFCQKSEWGNPEWLTTNIREGHGPLGALYPPTGFYPDNPGVQEGDTPTFTHLISGLRGLNDPEKPDQESWGGQYVQRDPSKNHWYDGPGAESIRKWLPDIQRDFARRADWMLPLSDDAEPATEPAAGIPYSPLPETVLVTKVSHFGNQCWKIAMAGGTWYFETGETNGRSGFNSAFDQVGNDWIGNDADKGYNKSSSNGGKHEYRGWPNFGNGNFDHPQRNSGASTRWVDASGEDIPFEGELVGDHLIMRSANDKYELEYHFFPTHAAIKVLKADDKYAFLFEGPVGGEQETSVEKDFYVLKDGKHRELVSGGLGYLEPEFGNDFPSPFFYLEDSDPNDSQVFYVGVKGAGPESAGDEGWRQGTNMVIFSYGRDEDKRAYTGTDAVCVFGFHDKTAHKEISRFIEQRLLDPFSPVGLQTQAARAEKELEFNLWLKDYIEANFEDVVVADNKDWFQARIPNQELVVNWAFLPQSQYTMKNVVGLYEGKDIFISSSVVKEPWGKASTIECIDGLGYYTSEYSEEIMGAFEVAKHSIVQFDGNGTDFVKSMAKAWNAREPLIADPNYKPRVINTTDLGADPDDKQSMVRQFAAANVFDIEGLVVSTGCWRKNQSNTDMLDSLVDAYSEAYPNLKIHADGYPTPNYIRSISVMGQLGYGMGDVGEGKDSAGSDMVIAAADKDDPRPVWVLGWGGMNVAAQAIWKVKETRTPTEFQAFLNKLRLFDILGQDDAGAWISKNFPEVFYIRATGVYGWAPSDEDLAEHIQNHGPLGEAYPNRKWATEGDSPAFMHLYPNGLNDPEEIDQGSWGGRFDTVKKAGIRSMSAVDPVVESSYDQYFMYGNSSEGSGAIQRWKTGYDNDFAARMDWSITENYEDANHHPIAVLNGDKSLNILEVSAKAGAEVVLKANGSSDPDGDGLNYSWSYYAEPSSYVGEVEIQGASAVSATLKVPEDASGTTLHLILEVYDSGEPSLYAYRRLIVSVLP